MDDEQVKRIAAQLRELRGVLKYTQAQVGERMGIEGRGAQSTVGAWEAWIESKATGRKPSPENLAKWASALGMTLKVEVRLVPVEPAA